jgi:hypothetical protein
LVDCETTNQHFFNEWPNIQILMPISIVCTNQ